MHHSEELFPVCHAGESNAPQGSSRAGLINSPGQLQLVSYIYANAQLLLQLRITDP